MIAYSEIMMRKTIGETVAIYIIKHPADLREHIQYKHIGDHFFRIASRNDYNYIKERSVELINYED